MGKIIFPLLHCDSIGHKVTNYLFPYIIYASEKAVKGFSTPSFL